MKTETISVKEFQEALGLGRAAAYREAPRWPNIRVGRRIFILRRPFERILNGEELPPNPEADAPEESGS